MIYTAAFKALGYTLDAPRKDWSARKDDGICVTLWQDRIVMADGKLHFDTRQDAPIEEWGDMHGNTLRKGHLAHALEKHDGYVDAIIVTGDSDSRSVKDADPWIAGRRRNMVWKITHLDGESGHFRVETEKAPAPKVAA